MDAGHPRCAVLLCLLALCLAAYPAPALPPTAHALDGPAGAAGPGTATPGEPAPGRESPAGAPFADALYRASLHATRAPALGAGLPDGRGPRPGGRPAPRPLELYVNHRVEGVIRHLLTRKRAVIERGYRRAGRYLPMIRAVFAREGLPAELAYLAAVESNFNPRARSPAGAVGLWQFTAATGRTFGLRIEYPWYDERRDPVSATHAAARLLAYLHDRYGDWPLALAAYNAGERRVNQALARARRSGRPGDYWSLRLPRQTRGFVPAFLATAELFEHPERHGLGHLPQESPLRAEPLRLSSPMTLGMVAERLGRPRKALARLNPAWRRGVVPAGEVEGPLLWVPAGQGRALLASLAADPPEAIPWHVHRVREGETVSHIAARYGVRTRDVLALNRLHRRSLLSIGQSVLVPVPAGAEREAGAARPPGPGQRAFTPGRSDAPALPALRLHRVREGESLWTISRRYDVRMRDVRRWNGLAGSLLHPGQVLALFPAASDAPWAAARSDAPPPAP